VTFTTADPFPDLSITSLNSSAKLFAGLNGTFSVSIQNKGTASAMAMSVTDTLPPEMTFVSGGTNGFTCSAIAQVVTCNYSGAPFTSNSISFFNITVAVSLSATATSLTHTVTVVSTPQDLIPSNNTATGTLPIQQVSAPTFTFAPSTLTAGQQATVGLSIPTSLPQDLSGTLTISFASTASNPADDPAIQFATGGRTVSFVIPANQVQARFAGATTAVPIGYQTGTVAGSISFSGTAEVGLVQKTFASIPNSSSLMIAPAPPIVTSGRTDSTNGFALLITSSSTPRSITDLVVQFFATSPLQLSCGTVAGCTASGSTLTFDVRQLFDGWFSGNTQFGGLSTFRLPLTVQGILHGSVSVSLKNGLGLSNTMSFPLP
jgi:uncharacterized repeat protein (TIGR01451 family)